MADEETDRVADSDGDHGRGIFDGFSGYVSPTEDDWKSVLSGGMLVIDTNVLLNLYRYNQDARESLLTALRKFDTRLWVPHQVMDEFWRNRESALEDPQKQLEQSKNALRSDLERTVSNLRNWVNRVSLDRPRALQLEATLENAVEEVIGEMEAVVDSSGVEMARETSKDKVVADLAALLDGKVGDCLGAEDHTAAVTEGKRRIEEQVPPGYRDKKKQTRGDDTEVGDYLVWCQLISEAKRRGQDVLLVTGDTKEDWWRTRNGITLGPRNELSEELRREAGVRLYMLKPDRLLTFARDILQVAVSQDSVQNVEMVDAQSVSDEAFRELEKQAESNPTDAFLATWKVVEAAVNRLLSAYDTPPRRRSSTMQAIVDLERRRLVSQDIVRTLSEMREFRNRLAHGLEVELTQEGAISLISRARGIVNSLTVALSPRAQTLRIEAAMVDLARGAGYEVTPMGGGGDRGFDIRVHNPARPDVATGIEIAYFVNGGEYDPQILEREKRRLSSLPEGISTLLIVTNASLPDSIQECNGIISASDDPADGENRCIRILQWESGDDDVRILDALAQATG
ncbi:PIN-like domain-containing protein [Streptomyces hokutonensis]|uniref:PIN-like domain-containing protein n=1 Tax=Streptomyces hokutonensis TaxID=1306990 RepID=UPI0033CEA970